MKKIGLITALEFEVPDQIGYSQTDKIQKVKTKDYEIAILVSGVGQKNAIAATKKLCIEYKPDIIFFIGFCGGVKKDCKACDLFLADIIAYNGSEIKIDEKTLGFVKQKLSENNCHHVIGKFQTFDDVVLSKKDIAPGIVAVEMESFGAVKEAKKYNIPTILIRTVSDIIPEKKSFFAKIKAQREFMKNIEYSKKSLNDFYEIFFLK
jgi:nucleoside phosphorylase